MKRRFNKVGKNKEVMEIDITSLLDILVILLVFLLKSYNASSLKLNLVKKLDMPNSFERNLGQHALIIQVDSLERIWVKNRRVGTVNDVSALEQMLRKENGKRELASQKPPTEGYLVNLVFDKELKYESIQKVMNICAENMYTKFKLIVKGDF